MTTFNSIGVGRTIGAGLNDLHATDFQISTNSTNGIITINLPPISDVLSERFKSGYFQLIAFLIADISGTAGTFKTIIKASSGELINGVSSIDLNTNNYSALLTITSDGAWSLLSGVSSGGSPTPPPFNNPFDFYLDASAPNGGDGSVEAPFNTITDLNNAVIALSNPTQGYIGNIAPSDTGYGSEVVGSLPIAPNLSLVGQTPQNTGISCNINYIGLALGSIVQFRNLAFNGVFTIDLSLCSFASISFQNGVVNINRTDSNPSAFVTLSGGIGGGTISGIVLIQNGILLNNLTINDGANVYAVNTFLLGSNFLLNGNCTLKTLNTLNPTSDYVNGVVDILGTPTWITDSASDATFTGTVNKTIFDWKVGGNSNGSEHPIGTLDNFDFPIIVNGVEVARITKDLRLFINQTTSNNGSNAGLQLASLIGNRSQMRGSQYGANNTGAGLSTFKSRGLVINAPLASGDGVLVGDLLRSDSAVGVTGSGLLIPIAFLMQVVVTQVGLSSVACDWEIQLCPLNGAINSRRKVFAVTSEGIQRVRESVNSMAGLAVLDGAGQLVIANTNVKATTRFTLTVQDGGSVPSGSLIYQSARTIGTNFTITSKGGALDSGVQVYYQLYEQLT